MLIKALFLLTKKKEIPVQNYCAPLLLMPGFGAFLEAVFSLLLPLYVLRVVFP